MIWSNYHRTLFFLLLATFKFGACNGNPIVTFTSGSVEGRTLKTLAGKEFFGFKGIPYAEPPTGELRFKPPVPAKPWSAILDGSDFGPECIQYDSLTKSVTGKEECLTLNVYTPKNYDQSSKFPIFVFIHGGVFIRGSGDMYGPGRLLDYDVILVTLNYRLHALGFLSTGDDIAPGNYGLLDQVEALKWVQKNIEAFGGNPDQVTLVGHSAGAASVIYHMLSPLCKGLIHHAISMSGSPMSPWAFSKDPLTWAEDFAKKVECTVENSEEMISCLKALPAKKLVQGLGHYKSGFAIPFSPSVDGYFLADDPIFLLRKGDIANNVPLIIGLNSNETLAFNVFDLIDTNVLDYPNGILHNAAKFLLKYEKDYLKKATRLIRKQYFGSRFLISPLRLYSTGNKFVSDGALFAPVYETISNLVNAGVKVYAYSYDYVPNNILSEFSQKYFGIVHGQDLFFLFDFSSVLPLPIVIQPNTREKARIIDLWLNFAKYGHPTTSEMSWKWQSSSRDNIRICHLDDNIIMDRYIPQFDWRLDFWGKDIPAAIAEEHIKGK